jgi:hypothetical protein
MRSYLRHGGGCLPVKREQCPSGTGLATQRPGVGPRNGISFGPSEPDMGYAIAPSSRHLFRVMAGPLSEV